MHFLLGTTIKIPIAWLGGGIKKIFSFTRFGSAIKIFISFTRLGGAIKKHSFLWLGLAVQ